MPRERLAHYKAKDPLLIGRRYLLKEGGATEEEVAAIEAAVQAEMETAIAFAKDSPAPSVAAFLREVGDS